MPTQDKTQIHKILKNHFSKISKPGSFSGINSFIRGLKESKINVKRSQVIDFLQSEDSYTLHKPVKKKFKRNRYIVNGIDDTFQIDLIDLSNISKYNDNYKYLFTCIDVFSKYSWVKPLKTKKAEESLKVFLEILSEGRKPSKIHADQGNEFNGIKKYSKENEINFYSTFSDTKACVVERFNRTLKTIMFRKITHQQNNHRYLDFLPKIVKTYNNTYHSTIKTKPNLVDKKNELQIWSQMYNYDLSDENKNVQSINFRFQIDDAVRITNPKNIFAKGYTQNWNREIFIINKKIPRQQPVYELRDQQGNMIQGKFYESELQKVNIKNLFLVEKVLKKQKQKNGQFKYFVKFLGYPEKYNNWVDKLDNHD